MDKNKQINALITDVAKIVDLPKGPEKLLKTFIEVGHNSGILLTSKKREDISKSLDIKSQTISNYITILIEKRMIRRIQREEYQFAFLKQQQFKEFYQKNDIEIAVIIEYSPKHEKRFFTVQLQSAT